MSAGCNTDEIQEPKPAAISATAAPTNGLVGEWKLDETGGTTAADTKNGYDATVFGGAAFAVGKLGNGLNVTNGSAGTGGKYAEMPSNATLDVVQEGDYTISAWFEAFSVPPSQSSANQKWAIVTKAGYHMGLVYDSAQTFSMRHYLTGDILKSPASAASYPINTWHHLAGVVSKTNGTVTLYVDGAVAGSKTFTPGTAARDYGTTPFRIGKGSTNWAADGRVDQVRIYNRALSAAEVSDLFHETTGGTAPTVTTNLASAIGTTTATLNGSANPNGSSATGWFRYGTTNPGTCNDTFGTRVPATGGTALGSGTSAVSYSNALLSLSTGTGYYYCAIASNSGGTSVDKVRFFVPVRFPVGMSKGTMSDIGTNSISWNPDGKIDWPGGNIPQILADAKTAGARIVIQVTSDNKNYFTSTSDSTFSLPKWEADFDRVKQYGDSIRRYVKDGTLIGHYAIDEPFIDFKNFQAAYLEQMCQYQKLSWPFVPCIVRINPAKLDSVKPAGGYKYVDAGWATLTDQQFDHAPFNGDFKAWYDTNLVAARRSGLAMMYGFNLINGGHEAHPNYPDNCAFPPPGTQNNCGMSAAEIHKMADAISISGLGHDQACGIIGWQLDDAAGSQRDYFFSQGIYLTSGVQSELQYLWNQTAGAGLRPAPCNIRGDLPPP